MAVPAVPYSDEFEKALLVGILSDTSLIPRVSGMLDESDFYREDHKEIYKAILSLDINEVDSLTVQNKLSGHTLEYFTDLVKNSDALLPSLTNIMVYAETIKDKSKLRDGIALGREIVALCYQQNTPASEVLQKLEDMFAKFLQNRVTDDASFNTKAAFEEFLSMLGKSLDDKGVVTGFNAIDMFIHRLDGLIILAARPSVGKTSLVTNIARNVAETRPVLFFSLEQTKKTLFERMLAAEAEVNSEEISTGAFMAEDYAVEKVKVASQKLLKVYENLHIDETSSITTTYATSVARQKKFEWGDLGLIIVDYLHIMSLDKTQNKVDSLGDAVKDLRALGKELGCPVIVLSQLSRQSDTFTDIDKTKRHRRPELTDLRSSGEIEQSADIVMFLHRESYYDHDQLGAQPTDDIIEVLIRKNRNGRIGWGTLGWTARYTKFKDL